MTKCSNCEPHPQCGTEAENAQAAVRPKRGCKMPPDLHVAVELNDSHFYMEQFAGTLELRITNLTQSKISNGVLKVSGKHLDGPGQCDFSLLPNEGKVFYLNIDFTKPGEPPVKFEMHYEYDCEIYACSQGTFFKVFAKTESIRKIEAHFTQNINVAEGGKFGFGLDNRTDILRGIHDEKIKDANDLIAQQLPPHWTDLVLPYDEQLTDKRRHQQDRVRIVSELANRREHVARACVLMADRQPPMRVLLLGTPRVRMGRVRSSNDVVLRVLPRCKANDAMSFWISKNAHLTVRVEPQGVILEDNGSTNGTYLNGTRIRKPTPLPLSGPSDVDVGKAITLRFTPFRDFNDPDPSHVERYCELGEPDDLWHAARMHGLRSIVIQRISNLSDSEVYVLVLRWLLIGRNSQGEIVLPGADFDARVLRLGGQFWLEAVDPGRGIHADAVPVPKAWACPLVPGMKLTCSTTLAECLPFRQCGL